MQAIINILGTFYNVSLVPSSFDMRSFSVRTVDGAVDRSFFGNNSSLLHDASGDFYGDALKALKAQASADFLNNLPNYLRKAVDSADAPMIAQKQPLKK